MLSPENDRLTPEEYTGHTLSMWDWATAASNKNSDATTAPASTPATTTLSRTQQFINEMESDARRTDFFCRRVMQAVGGCLQASAGKSQNVGAQGYICHRRLLRLIWFRLHEMYAPFLNSFVSLYLFLQLEAKAIRAVACQAAVPDFKECRMHHFARSMVENDFIHVQRMLKIGTEFPHRNTHLSDEELLQVFKEIYIDRVATAASAASIHAANTNTSNSSNSTTTNNNDDDDTTDESFITIPPLRNISPEDSDTLIRFRAIVGSQMKDLQAIIESPVTGKASK